MTRELFARVAKVAVPISYIFAAVYAVLLFGTGTVLLPAAVSAVGYVICLTAAFCTGILASKYTNYDQKYTRMNNFAVLHFFGAMLTGLAIFADETGHFVSPLGPPVMLSLILVILVASFFCSIAIGKRYKADYNSYHDAIAHERLMKAVAAATSLSLVKCMEIIEKADEMTTDEKDQMAYQLEQYAEYEVNKPDWLK